MRVTGSLVALVVMGMPIISSAAVSYTTPGDTVAENFDGPAAGAATTPWADDSTIPHWYAYQGGGAEAAGPVSQIRTTNGSSSGIVLFRWRTPAGSGDFALGTKPVDATGDVMIGWRITNNTGVTLTSFTLGYTGEQWSADPTGNNNQLVPAYQVGSPAHLADGTWTQIPELVFNSPHDDLDDSTVDGNDPANREVLAPVTVIGLTWEPGADLWIRWYDNNTSGADQGLAVDDITFSAMPEPASAALMMVGAALLMARR